ncbi:hypothetical protein TVAG_060320 [Trichomonas vaginalis G3]|uniref:Rad21/Rec8-like protein N-terminal domain-containing protein n=1 Tax=Trichomonas vaginalis (strain ATCC PRA-98 / G3) TaxID=412133 RepID=A2ECG1_TRIV3|nr:Rad21A-like protein [Trichomonas vaginalis G3]EAY09656.1 hypothetical protein TVAG_060320 [Trichomonas vaginalis G3]KAI5528658.1 Rad21A-like protein [Trichomonas vaginalis G3]|eukprot:XP_001321879.1 hypothetical protein [Trichomonas vaginalis G3]
MFTTQDLISRKDSIGDAWRIGMSEDTKNKDKIMGADITMIANEIINNEGKIPLRLSTMIMKGTVIIYNKKTGFVYGDCKDILSRISLKYDSHQEDKEETTNNSKSQRDKTNKNVIDDETLLLWEQATTNNIILQNIEEEAPEDSTPHEINVTASQNPTLLGLSVHESHSNESANYGLELEENIDLGINISDSDDVDSVLPQEISDHEENQNLSKMKGESSFDAVPRISIAEFWDSYGVNNQTRRPRNQISPNFNGLPVIAEPLSEMFIYIKENVNIVDEIPENNEIQNQISDFEGIPDNDDDIPQEMNNEQADIIQNEEDSGVKEETAEMLLKLIKKSKKENNFFDELTEEMSVEEKASCFYAALSLFTKGVIKMEQDSPQDRISISTP